MYHNAQQPFRNHGMCICVSILQPTGNRLYLILRSKVPVLMQRQLNSARREDACLHAGLTDGRLAANNHRFGPCTWRHWDDSLAWVGYGSGVDWVWTARGLSSTALARYGWWSCLPVGTVFFAAVLLLAPVALIARLKIVCCFAIENWYRCDGEAVPGISGSVKLLLGHFTTKSGIAAQQH
ncbi:hypothetical protein BDP27DRAFT_1369482 [Rhodocollybia butyracea]|uniref:Uncharacterized protein n=1 Tax=Rhodocollybia butyracea TaxID=206335 RepID=A0A9P5PA17_9AGAR|nr:hypothetical protein BDP27DRAFT_1369482 [Rhodocollybia butyracea]